MSFTFIVLAGFYPAARRALHYADTLAQALNGQLVLLHVTRASLFDPYEMLGETLRQEELDRQTDTAAALYRQAEELRSPATVEVVTDLLPEVAQDLASRCGPVLFVLGQPGAGHPAASNLVTACAELLRAGHHPLLVVPAETPTEGAPRNFLLAADQEPFTLAASAQPLRQLLTVLGTQVVVAHVSEGVEDDAGCAAALRAVQGSGLVTGLRTPELRGYEADSYPEGLLAAVQDTGADLLIMLARQRSYLGELFHRSVTARLLLQCPVPVLVLPTASEVPHADAAVHQTTRILL